MNDDEFEGYDPENPSEVVEYLKITRNELVGNPSNKLQFLDADYNGHPLIYR